MVIGRQTRWTNNDEQGCNITENSKDITKPRVPRLEALEITETKNTNRATLNRLGAGA